MHRVPRPDDPRLETLLHERDHARVQISLLLDADEPNHAQIRVLEQELNALEKLIQARK